MRVRTLVRTDAWDTCTIGTTTYRCVHTPYVRTWCVCACLFSPPSSSPLPSCCSLFARSVYGTRVRTRVRPRVPTGHGTVVHVYIHVCQNLPFLVCMHPSVCNSFLRTAFACRGQARRRRSGAKTGGHTHTTFYPLCTRTAVLKGRPVRQVEPWGSLRLYPRRAYGLPRAHSAHSYWSTSVDTCTNHHHHHHLFACPPAFFVYLI